MKPAVLYCQLLLRTTSHAFSAFDVLARYHLSWQLFGEYSSMGYSAVVGAGLESERRRAKVAQCLAYDI